MRSSPAWSATGCSTYKSARARIGCACGCSAPGSASAPICSAVYAVPPKTGRWRMSLILLGGFLGNVALAALVAALLALASPWVSGPVAACLFVAGSGLAVSETVRAPLCLWPKTIKIGGARLPSDGLALFRLWRRPRDPDRAARLFDVMEGARLSDAGLWAEARAHYEAASRRDPSQGWHVSGLLHVIGRLEGARAVVDWFMDHRSEIEAQAALAQGSWSLTLGNAGWQMARLHDPELLPLALELSGRAMETAAAYAPIRATRGAALLASGDSEGRAMLLAALPEIEDPIDRAEFVAFLGEEASRAGDDASGSALRGLEAHLLKAA
jgi:hypothetical protein